MYETSHDCFGPSAADKHGRMRVGTHANRIAGEEGESESGGADCLGRLSRRGAIVTPLWWLEIFNALIQAEKRGRITA